MTKPTAAKIAQFRAIAGRKTAANDDAAPKAKGTLKLKLSAIVATVFFTDVKIAEDANGNPYYAFKDASVVVGETETVRTVMAFESYDLVGQVVRAGQDLVVTLENTGSTMKIVGVLVDGEMKMVEPRLPKAA